jgi:cell shape-determining protein MreC
VLLNVDNCILSVKEKWKTLRSSILTNESLTNQIVALEHTVVDSGAMARETKRWPDGAHTTNYDDLIQYATDKMNYLDTYFATLGEE